MAVTLSEAYEMMYPFLTLDDGTEIVHSEMLPEGRVKVYMERPDEELGFLHAACFLPGYEWEDIIGFSKVEMERLRGVLHSNFNLILQSAQK